MARRLHLVGDNESKMEVQSAPTQRHRTRAGYRLSTTSGPPAHVRRPNRPGRRRCPWWIPSGSAQYEWRWATGLHQCVVCPPHRV